MRVGIMELLIDTTSRNGSERAYAPVRRSYYSIAPQAVAVWCRHLGHQVFYATYYGQRDPKRLLPADLDIVFLSTYTQSSALAYALAKLYRMEQTLTVIGGPHAKSFPEDCLRFFDWVVQDCDKALVAEILRGACNRQTIVSSGHALTEPPSVEERLPEITTATFTRGKPAVLATVPILASVGCPYTCNFCVDWNTPYISLPREQLDVDLRYLSTHLPNVMVAFHDPNFGVKFDQVLDSLETIAPAARSPYLMESSLSILRGPRLQRLQDTNCLYVAPGVESWAGYSNKAGVGQETGEQKLKQLVDHFELLHQYVSGLQANFIFGCDVDQGDTPVELTKEFIRRLPFVWPTVNIPVPFGGTPLYDSCLAEERILRSMPFSFYYTPYLVTTLQHYDPVAYYSKLIEIYSVMTSAKLLTRRLASTTSWGLRILHALRTFSMRQDLAAFRQLQKMLQTDSQFRAFHEGRSDVVPAFYHHQYDRKLGRYAELIPQQERKPELSQPEIIHAPTHH